MILIAIMTLKSDFEMFSESLGKTHILNFRSIRNEESRKTVMSQHHLTELKILLLSLISRLRLGSNKVKGKEVKDMFKDGNSLKRGKGFSLKTREKSRLESSQFHLNEK